MRFRYACAALTLFFGAGLPHAAAASATALVVAQPASTVAPTPETTPVPAPAVTPAPPAATPEPTPPPARRERRAPSYLVGEVTPFEYVHNYLSGGQYAGATSAYFTPSVATALTFPVSSTEFMIAGEFRTEAYRHSAGKVPTAGGGSVFIPDLVARDYTQDFRVGFKIANPRIFIGVGSFYRAGSYGFPELVGAGFGVEALPDLRRQTSIFGRAYFYPNVNNEDPFNDVASGRPLSVRYSYLRYGLGEATTIGGGPMFFIAGLDGSRYWHINDVPSNDARLGLTLGYGIRF